MNIKEIFAKADEDGKLTLEQFEQLAKDGGAKFADLSEGKYVSKAKYEDDLKAKDADIQAKEDEKSNLNAQIETLNGTITSRDEDLANLQKQLEEAGEDATKLAELNNSFTALQTKYDADVKGYQEQMQKQAYEFAVKEFANTKSFTSNAAKRDFVNSMLAKQLAMEDGKILGREDFAEKYASENEDAFVVEVVPEEVVPAEVPQEPAEPEKPIPTFVGPTSGPTPDSGTDTGFNFNFTGVRPKQ